MNNLTQEIPQRAFINAQIVQEAIKTPGFQKAIKKFERHYSLGKYEFINPAYVVSLLYCLLVVPRELWVKDENHQIYTKLSKSGFVDLFTIEYKENGFNNAPEYNLLRSLRNSISHARFEVDHENNFIFWDKRSENTKPHIKVSISISNLERCLSVFGSMLANLHNPN